ncbi:MAG: sodium:panthothenate symporter, partial [Lentisphaeria bacterium]|nr:sodium:panthothenate symporter [Lentisphaeria bacterium]
PMQTRNQIWLIRWLSVLVAVIFFVASLLMAQMDYLQLFVIIVGAVWTGGAGAVVCFGLYSRFGTTAGAFASLISGALISVSGMLTSRNWADVVYPWLDRHGWVPTVARAFDLVTKPFQPYIVWQMNPKKFPINAYEILFLAIVASIIFYVSVSMLTFRKPFNLDRMLHRGEYSDDKTRVITSSWSLRNIFSKLVGIGPEYTRGDRVIAYSVFAYTFVYRFFLTFIVVIVINMFTTWGNSEWSIYNLITIVAVPFVVGAFSSVWFFIGGVVDLRHLFIDLEARKRDYSDDGRVEKED